MLKNIPKNLWVIVATLSLVLAGVLGTSPANAQNGVVQVECNIVDRVGFSFYWENDSSETRVFEFDSGIIGEPTSTYTVNPVGIPPYEVDFGRGIAAPMDGNAYTMTITINDVLVYQADWIYACPWQGMSVTVDSFTAATDPSPSPSPTVSASPTPTVEPTPTVVPTPTPTVEPTPTPTVEPPATLADQTLKAPKKVLKKGKVAKLAKTTQQGAKVRWRVKGKKTCKVKAGKVKAGKKKGTCRLAATAPALPNFKAYTGKFTVKVK